MRSAERSPAARRAAELLGQQELKKAMDACTEALAADPADADVEHVLAQAYRESGNPTMAVMILQHVLAQRPDDPEVHASLGRSHRLIGEHPEAEAALRRALDLDPSSAHAREELVELYVAMERPDSALEQAEVAVRRHPDRGGAHFAMAAALRAAGRDDEARMHFGEAIARDRSCARIHLGMAELYRKLGDPRAAERTLEAGVFFQPHDPELTHMVAAAGHEATQRRASDEYLVRHFDQFAETFDTRLNELGYDTPEKLAERLRLRLAGREGTLAILDAGCGTGLLAPLVRDMARTLVGVDISPGMLERARERGLYDELHAEELVEFLGRRPGAYDVVVAADVLIYFGDIAELVARMAAALKPGGVIAVSAEKHEGAGHEFRASGRWAHSEAELRSAADAAGLRLDIEDDVLRLEFGAPIAGLLAVGGRSEGPAAA